MLLPIMPLLLSNAAESTPASTVVRPAATVDIDRIVDLCQADRHRFADEHAGFYSVGPNYAGQKRDSIAKLIDGGDGLALVHETNGQVDGVILGILVFAPPVYNPPGKVCSLRDFVAPIWSQPASNLLAAASKCVEALGGVLFIAECMGSAKDKRHFLTTAGFEVASDWYQRFIEIPEPKKAVGGIIEAAKTGDIPAIVALCQMRLLQKQKYQPIFWRKADDSAEKQSSYFSWLMSQGKSIMLVHRVGGKIDGFIIANPFGRLPYGEGQVCDIDDFTVADDHLWNIGEWLLYSAAQSAKAEGATVVQVVAPDAEHPKRHLLDQSGFKIGHQWLVRPTVP